MTRKIRWKRDEYGDYRYIGPKPEWVSIVLMRSSFSTSGKRNPLYEVQFRGPKRTVSLLRRKNDCRPGLWTLQAAKRKGVQCATSLKWLENAGVI